MRERPKILDQWDEIQHAPLTIPPDNFSGMELDDAVSLIKEWFFENFEDPVHVTPYVSAEGGYQYIWGGPYDARDIVENVFAETASIELIESVIEEIESEGSVWVPNSSRRYAPDENDEPTPPQDVASLHAEMLLQISGLEESFDKLPSNPSGIGHNRPPEPIEATTPLNENDQNEIITAIKILKIQPVEPEDHGKAAKQAAGILKLASQKIGEWLLKQADTFASEAKKEAGKEFGKWGTRTVIWSLILDKLLSVHEIVGQWLSKIHLPF